MARLPRYVLPGQPQHIIQRGNNRQVIFTCDEDFQFFRDAVVHASEQHGLAIHAYVWMSNHIHLLATPDSELGISKVFQSVGRKYVQYFNRTYHRTGTLWEGRYRATVVDSEAYLMKLMRYIELNPVRAGMVAHPCDYAWSSYARNADAAVGVNADWIKPHDVYLSLAHDPSDRSRAYCALFNTVIDNAELAQIRDCTHKGWALGDEQFKAEMQMRANRQSRSKGVGRPRISDARK